MEIAELFVELGVNPTKSNVGTETLRRAAANGKLGMVELFLDLGVDPKSEAGTEALRSAALESQWAIVKYLLASGVDPKSKAGTAALQQATSQAQWDIVKRLLSLRAGRAAPPCLSTHRHRRFCDVWKPA